MTRRLTWLILILVAIALRSPDVGNPLVDVDEQMYLLVGQRMWDGAIPYVDIWDRKPIGLFLIFAAARLVPGNAVIVGHLFALAAAVATAGLITTFARRFARPAGALAAGIGYLVWLELIGGRGGQSPVFYDLPVVAAALLTWDTVTGRRRGAMPAMLLAGLALQIKPTAMFEGAFFGIALLWAGWHRGLRPLRLAAQGILYMAVASVPTLIALAVYAAMGHADAWWFANVQSIFLRHVVFDASIAKRLLGCCIVLLVPAIMAVRGLHAQGRPERAYLGGWLVSAVVGWLCVPPYFNHYALPLLVPLAVTGARALDRRPMQVLLAVSGAGLLLLSGYPHVGESADMRHRLAMLAERIDRVRGQGCLFVFEAPSALYTATRSCLPTRFPFPYHLVEADEAPAIGVDQTAEVAHILAAGPPVIAAGDIARNHLRPTSLLVRRALADHYRPIARDLGVTVYRRVN